GGGLVGAAGPDAQGDAVAGGDRQNIAHAALFQLTAQARALAADLVAGGPPRVHSGVQRADDHAAGQLGLGGNVPVGGHTGRLAPSGVAGPGLGQVDVPVDEGVPGVGGIAEKDRDLAVLDASGGAGVLALHPDAAGALLQIAGLVHHQHRPGRPEVLGDVAAQVIAYLVGVPHRPAQQVLHPVRVGVPG